MRDMLTRRVSFVAVAVSMVSCASDGGGKRDEVVGTQRQSVQTFLGPVVRGSTTKVCQLIGNSADLDYETRQETDNKTSSRFGIAHTDLGYPVAEGNRTWFFFGDVSAADDSDPLGFTDETPDPNDRTKCPKLEFTVDGGSADAQAVTLDGSPLKRGGSGLTFPPASRSIPRRIASSDTSYEASAARPPVRRSRRPFWLARRRPSRRSPRFSPVTRQSSRWWRPSSSMLPRSTSLAS